MGFQVIVIEFLKSTTSFSSNPPYRVLILVIPTESWNFDYVSLPISLNLSASLERLFKLCCVD